MSDSSPRIVILGAGFAALTAVRELRKRAPKARITLVAPKAEFVALAGQAPSARFKVDLICIVDTIDKGILVYRDIKRSYLLPASRLFHWAKRSFERHYLLIFR